MIKSLNHPDYDYTPEDIIHKLESIYNITENNAREEVARKMNNGSINPENEFSIILGFWEVNL